MLVPRTGHGYPLPQAMILLLFLGACASQRPPEGGPPDTEAPFVVETVPANKTVNFRDQEVSLLFSEHVQRQSFLEAVHISPLPDVQPTYEWSGRRVTILFPSPLLADRTYVISVGTKVKDLRGGNAMKETMHLAFSTGDSLDNGSFEGTVATEPLSGVTLFAYLLSADRADTLNPAKDRPDYAVQSGVDGGFRFFHVSPGTYRVFAVRDKGNDMRYDAESDEIGIANDDIMVRDSLSLSPPLRFHLHVEDTTRPSIQRVEALSVRVLRAKFNETVYPQPLPLEHLIVTDSVSSERLAVISAMAPQKERFAWDLLLATPMSDRTYLLVIDSLEDGAGNAISTADHAISFSGTTVSDTVRPAIVARVPEMNARGFEPDSAFQISFDRPVTAGGTAFALRDSGGIAIEIQWNFSSPSEVTIMHPPLLPDAAYSLCIDMTLLHDSLNLRTAGDSTECFRFTTGKRDQAGSVAGQVRTDDSTGTVFVRIRDASKQPRMRTKRTDSTRVFRFEGLREGQYLMDAYIDRNGNNRHDLGKPFPLTRPEPYSAVRDTLRVRARWETNGIIIPLQSSSSPAPPAP